MSSTSCRRGLTSSDDSPPALEPDLRWCSCRASARLAADRPRPTFSAPRRVRPGTRAGECRPIRPHQQPRTESRPQDLLGPGIHPRGRAERRIACLEMPERAELSRRKFRVGEKPCEDSRIVRHRRRLDRGDGGERDKRTNNTKWAERRTAILPGIGGCVPDEFLMRCYCWSERTGTVRG
jgi:hypothetical protein